MGSIANVNPKLDRVDAKPGGKVAFSFSVVNTSGRSLKLGARVIPEGTTDAAWFDVLGASERELGADDLDQFDVEASLPTDVAPGDYRFKLLVYSTDDPGEDFDESPSVVASIAAETPPEKPKPQEEPPEQPFPWWIVAVAGVVVIVIGVLAYVFWPSPETPEPVRTVAVPKVLSKPLDEAKRLLAEKTLKAIEVPETRPRDDDSKLNVVRYQFPKTGARVEPGSEVNLVYYTSKSLGTSVYVLPDGAIRAVPLNAQPKVEWQKLQPQLRAIPIQ